MSRWDRWRGRRPRWCVLHSVPVGVSRSSDIDHVLGGPAVVTTKHHQIGKVRIDGDELTPIRRRIGYVTKAVLEAERAQRSWAPESSAVTARWAGVLVDRPGGLSFRLSSMREVLADGEVTALFDIARRSTTWARV